MPQSSHFLAETSHRPEFSMHFYKLRKNEQYIFSIDSYLSPSAVETDTVGGEICFKHYGRYWKELGTVRHERLFIQLAINELYSGQSTSTIGLRFCCGNMSPIVLGIKKHLHHRLIAHCTF